MIKKYLGLAILLVCPASTVQAQHPLILQELIEWNEAAPALSDEKLRTELLSTAIKIYASSDACSNSEVLIDRSHPATANRFVFTAVLNQRLRNAWTVTARLPGCDIAPVRFMVMQDMDDNLRTIRVNRGISYAWDSLIGDTLPLAHMAANTALRREGIDCELGADFKLGVIRIASESDGLSDDQFGVRYSGSWSEIWPIKMCARTVEVLVNFTGDGDGGAYSDIPGKQVAILAD